MTKILETTKIKGEKEQTKITTDNLADKKNKRVENVTKRLKNKVIRQNINKNKEPSSQKIPDEDLKFYPDFTKKLVTVAYPGNVENIDKVLETLGGLETISDVACNENRRLELRFRPKDAYCKPCCADRDDSLGIVIKVKVHRVIPSGPSCSRSVVEPIKETYETTVIGVSKLIFNFKTLNDFQYLPIDLKQGSTYPGELVPIYEKLIPKEIPDYAWILDGEDLAKNSLFLPPAIFSRFDTMSHIIGKKVIRKKEQERSKESNEADEDEEEEVEEGQTDLPTLLSQLEQQKEAGKDDDRKKRKVDDLTVGRLRKRRVHYGLAAQFKDETVPQKPAPNAIKMLRIKFLDRHYVEMQDVFNERPIWSKSGVQFKTKLSKMQLKYLLPTVAYYFQSGPWRCMWVRYAYDPRKDSSSRKYQTFDFRVRKGGVGLQVKAKREYRAHFLPYKSSTLNKNKPKVPLLKCFSLLPPEEVKETEGEKLEENSFMFRPGTLPPSRQCLYQYCDILLPEIEAMFARLPDITADQKCHEKNGWLPSGFDDQCREIMNKYCSDTIKSNLLEEQQKKLQGLKIAEENEDKAANGNDSDEEYEEEPIESDADSADDETLEGVEAEDEDDVEILEVGAETLPKGQPSLGADSDNVQPSTSFAKN